MAESVALPRPESSQTLVIDGVDSAQTQSPPTLRLRCRKPKTDKNVRWNEETVDNEHMNKKKSKCCCIYKKPKQRFDESSDSESDECENCYGHVEVKKEKQKLKHTCKEESYTEPS